MLFARKIIYNGVYHLVARGKEREFWKEYHA